MASRQAGTGELELLAGLGYVAGVDGFFLTIGKLAFALSATAILCWALYKNRALGNIGLIAFHLMWGAAGMVTPLFVMATFPGVLTTIVCTTMTAAAAWLWYMFAWPLVRSGVAELMQRRNSWQ